MSVCDLSDCVCEAMRMHVRDFVFACMICVCVCVNVCVCVCACVSQCLLACTEGLARNLSPACVLAGQQVGHTCQVVIHRGQLVQLTPSSMPGTTQLPAATHVCIRHLSPGVGRGPRSSTRMAGCTHGRVYAWQAGRCWVACPDES